MKPFATYDLYMAAFISARGAQLVYVASPPGETWKRFIFDDSLRQASGAFDDWKNNRTYVDAKQYAIALRYLKRMMRESRIERPELTGENTNGSPTVNQ